MPEIIEPTKELILPRNYANNDETAKRAVAHVVKIWNKAVDARSEMDSRMRQYFNIWNTLFDIRYYEGRSQVYSPQLRKNVEFAVRNTKKNLFPTDDYFTIDSPDDEEGSQADKVKRFLRWQQVNKINLKRYVTPFLRQLFVYGWSPVKVVWLEQLKKIYTHERQILEFNETLTDPVTGEKIRIPAQEEAIVQVEKEIPVKQHPSFYPVDVFGFYIYPWTCWDVNDAYCVMEDISLTKEQLEIGKENKVYTNTDEVIKLESNVSTKRVHSKKKRMAVLGVSDETIKEASEWHGVEYWGKFDLLDNGKEIDCLITVMEDKKCIQVRQNPHYDQEPGYLVGKLDELVGDFYGKGLIEPLQTLQYFLNDTKNQMNDAMTYSLMPIVKYVPGMLHKNSKLVLAPGAMWALNDVNGAAFDRPPDLAQSGLITVQNTTNEIDSYPGFERIPTTGRRPATQIQALQEERGINILDWSENLEVQVMSPFLRKQFMLNQQFLDDEVWFKVLGQKPEKISAEDLVGNYHFYWLGANQTQNLIVKSRQMIEALNIALAIPPSPTEIPDYWYIFKRIWKEGLGLDGEDKLIREIDFTAMIDPVQENMILLIGKQLPVSQLDNDQEHMQIHSQLFNVPELPEASRNIIETHVKMHMNKLMQLNMMQNQSGRIAPTEQQFTGEETNAQMLGGGGI